MPPDKIKKQPKPLLDEANDYRPPSDLELWSVLQKLLTFEDPSAKWLQVRKALRKQLQKSGTGQWNLREQATLTGTIFHDLSEINPVEELLNTILAYEDLRRFNRLAFDAWFNAAGGQPEPDQEHYLFPNVTGQAEKAWLIAADEAVPAWLKLKNNGPWFGDTRAEFLMRFVSTNQESESSKAFQFWKELVCSYRKSLSGSFLPEIIVLAEGETESFLLPAFAKLLSANFNAMAVHLESCGGDKQVVKHYLYLKELTVLPIICVLDGDVGESIEIINDSLRVGDRIVTLAAGEMEDCFSLPIIHRTVNMFLRLRGCLEPIAFEELKDSELGRIETLDRLFKARGLGSFDKIGFAQLLANNLSKTDVPDDGKRIINAVVQVHHAGVKFRFE